DVKGIGDDNPLCAAEIPKMLFVMGRQRQRIDEYVGPLVRPKETIEVDVQRLLERGPTKKIPPVQALHFPAARKRTTSSATQAGLCSPSTSIAALSKASKELPDSLTSPSFALRR